MSVLNRVPLELLLVVLNYLESKSDWLSLARSCRALLDRIRPLLYESIQTPCYCIGVHKTLVHTLLRHPELAQSVRHARLGRLKRGTDPATYASHRHEHYECAESTETLKRAVNVLSHRDWEATQWAEDLDANQHRDPWLAILLYLLPCVETLELFWGGSGTKYSAWVLDRASKRSSPFHNSPVFVALHTAVIKVPEDEGMGFTPMRLAPFFRLPSLRTLKGQLMTDRHQNYTVAPPNSSAIEHLELVQCSSTTGFIDLISPCRNLRSFTYTHQECTPETSEYKRCFFRALLPVAFTKSLAVKRDTLQSIMIDDYRASVANGGRNGEKYIGCMAGFRNLRHLHIPARFFLGSNPNPEDNLRIPLVDFLPVSIESLWISEISVMVGPLIQKELLQLIAASEDRFVNLRQIDLEGRSWIEKALPENVEGLRGVYPYYSHLLNRGILEEFAELGRCGHRTGVKIMLRDHAVEAAMEDYDDVSLFVADADSDEDW
ncbi:uncharacterized protein N7459_000551 [Penicillium hispanicum]|uniref:uncharacterized protein n=1 Tax=Penicillium hispanicum TaxID=1080232 RepID=UPI00253FCC1E|nr:uncharacterized protein N7459_000551 [Penicillium hispanicum]KAJ5594343.1 hypothetical protein N7459_000551 [Penicillium hispanicum]